MGTAASDFPHDTVLACVNAVLDVFIPLFVKAVGVRIVEVAIGLRRVEESELGDGGWERQLLKPPIATVPLRRGWVKMELPNGSLRKRCVPLCLCPGCGCQGLARPHSSSRDCVLGCA